MAPLIFFAALFICGLLNSYFFPPSKLLPSLRSLLKSFAKPKKPATVDNKTKKKDDKQQSARASPPDELDTIFSTFDGDGDGFITAEELQESLTRLRLSVTPDEVRSMMERADANGDGLLDADEFRRLYESLERSGGGGGGGGGGEEEGDELKEAFEVFDGDGDGVITVEELRMVLMSMGFKEEAKEEGCRAMIRRVDMDGDGKVNYEEFKKMMVKDGKLF